MQSSAVLLRLLTVAIVALNLVVLEWTGHADPFGATPPFPNPLEIVPVSLALAQVALLMSWLMYGERPLVRRLAIVGIALVGVHLAFLVYSRDVLSFAYGLLSVLLALKLWRSWIVDPWIARRDGIYDRRQMSLAELLLAVAMVALAMAYVRFARTNSVAFNLWWAARVLLAVAAIRAVLRPRTSIWRVATTVSLVACLGLYTLKWLPATLVWHQMLILSLEAMLLVAGLVIFRVAGVRVSIISENELPLALPNIAGERALG